MSPAVTAVKNVSFNVNILYSIKCHILVFLKINTFTLIWNLIDIIMCEVLLWSHNRLFSSKSVTYSSSCGTMTLFSSLKKAGPMNQVDENNVLLDHLRDILGIQESAQQHHFA